MPHVWHRTCFALLIAISGSAVAVEGNRITALPDPGSFGTPAAVDGERLRAADKEPGNWMSTGRTYDEQRYSPLTEINTSNVDQLGLAWRFDLNTHRGLEATPLAIDGVLYFSGTWSVVYAVDGRTGELLWKYDPQVDRAWGINACCDVVNRGVAAWNGKIYVGTIDGRLVAIDAKSGNKVWETLTIDKRKPYSITGAPRIVNGKVVIGNGGAEYGVRGYVTAYDSETGEQAWRFYTVPGNPADPPESPAMEMALKTWNGGEWWTVGGGGTAWDSMAFDADLNLLYIGVGNASPWSRWVRSPGGGDNLFLSSIVALNPDTGAYVWHYQTTPAETWDYTATQHMILADIEIDGETRKVIMQAPKNGFFYVIDRETGEFISAENYVPVNWASHVDPETGRPVETDEQFRDQAKMTVPSPFGGHNWQPMSYHPGTGLVYIPAREMAFKYEREENFKYGENHWNMAINMEAMMPPAGVEPKLMRRIMKAMARGHISAWDPVNQREVWRVKHPGPWDGGMLSTAGNLLFQGTAEGELKAYDVEDGTLLWQHETQSGIVAAPISYAVDGDQYVAILVGWGGALGLAGGIAPNLGEKVGGRLLAFKLGAQGELPAVPEPPAPPKPPEQTASTETITRGHQLYHTYCNVCHGMGAESGVLADLRHMTPHTHKIFNDIVLDGIYSGMGMAGFGDYINKDDAEAIHAYLIEMALAEQAELNESATWSAIKEFFYGLTGSIAAFYVDLST
ncbi:MAG: PQQ-dependent dehydrogenase, methanol/ethanol family [Immundisolibacteraceae bacterium]|nr:PQQ-dependent dehydrogenase, methanol/ethanol family [Immundisolibacteraceae bacterium]